jgi:hypothetical protein
MRFRYAVGPGYLETLGVRVPGPLLPAQAVLRHVLSPGRGGALAAPSDAHPRLARGAMTPRNRSHCLLAAALALAVAGCAQDEGEPEVAPPIPSPVTVVEEHDVGLLNGPQVDGMLTADLVIFHSDNTEVTWEEMEEEFRTADSIYRDHGVQLNLKKAVKVAYPDAWTGLPTGEGTNVPADDLDLDFYEMIDFEQEVLPDTLEHILDAFLENEQDRERTLFVIPLGDMTVSWYERDENNTWKEVTAATSATSFPPYMLADRVPKHLRGVISFQRSKPGRRVLAHELGHKLINVSHEGLGVCPQGTGDGVPGLMGYANEKEIYGGREGRWHRERLLLSPFLYRVVDGVKIYNGEFRAGGAYDDPIYGEYVMRPACPTSE